MKRIFIDGEHGTTGLEIRARLAGRDDIEVVSLPRERAKDTDAKCAIGAEIDLAILCLPDEAAREAAPLFPRVIDASTAHRTSWVYGFPELGLRDAIRTARQVANPGCYPTGFLGLVRPLRDRGLLADSAALTVHAISGYTGGGIKLIEAFERGGDRRGAFGAYGLTLAHKHVAEMQHHAHLAHPPLFAPAVGNFARGMLVHVPLPIAPPAAELHAALAEHYAGEPLVTVHPVNDLAAARDGAYLEPEMIGDRLELFVFANDRTHQALLVARLDNLGKGASGAAVQNANLMLGLPEWTGLGSDQS